jgi:hypothetical protein
MSFFGSQVLFDPTKVPQPLYQSYIPIQPIYQNIPAQPVNESKRLKSTHACEYCKKQHRKCDGNNPCKNCEKRGIECVYVARKKRGPRKPKILKRTLSTELEKQPQKKTKTLEEQKQQNDMVSYLTSCINTFMQNEKTYRPLFSEEFEKSLPNLITKAVTPKQEEYKDSKMFLLFAMLAMATRHAADVTRANEFHNIARTCAGNLFDS